MARRRARSSRAVRAERPAGRSSPPAAPADPGGALPSPSGPTAEPTEGAPLRTYRDLGGGGAPSVRQGALRGLRPARGPALPLRAALELIVSIATSASPCPACDAAGCGPEGICKACEHRLREAVRGLPPPAGDTLWLGPHAGAWRRLVHALKYRHARRLAPYLAGLLHVRVRSWGWQPDIVVHVPTSAERRRVRGYDQAELLAGALASLIGRPHLSALRRRHATSKLVGLGRGARGAALEGAFSARYLPGRRVLLVDDVLTTGATLGAARRALLDAGAAEVRAAVVARTSSADAEAGAPPPEEAQ